MDIFQTGVTFIRWQKWFMETGLYTVVYITVVI